MKKSISERRANSLIHSFANLSTNLFTLLLLDTMLDFKNIQIIKTIYNHRVYKYCNIIEVNSFKTVILVSVSIVMVLMIVQLKN